MSNTQAQQQSVQASDAEKRALANLQALGRDLATQLFVCFKTASFYDSGNSNYKKQIDKLHHLISVALDSDQELLLTSVEGYLFFNQQRLKINLDGYLAAKYLQENFEKWQISGLAFETGIEINSLSAAVFELIKGNDSQRGAEKLNSHFNERGISGVRFIEVQELVSSKDEQPLDDKTGAKKSFFKAISVVQEVMTASVQGRQIHLIKAKRAIHSLVDEIIKNESYLLELTALRNFDQYTYKHSVNVSVFAVALGLRLGFTKSQLAELGFAALFHDFGKTRIPIDLLNKPNGLDKADWSRMQEHPTFGARALAQSFSMDRYTGRAMLVAFEHHKNLDGTGYPYVNSERNLNLYSRIVAICDFFDALTSGRSYRKKALPVDEVILKMIQQTKVKFDPYLLKVFINIVGIYPVGSLLLLDTGELALVVQNNPEDLFRPEVKIIADRNGKKYPAPRTRLASYDDKNDRYFRNVLHLVDPDKYGIDISGYILED